MKERVKGPAAGLVAVGIVGGLGGIANFLLSLLGGPDQYAGLNEQLGELDVQIEPGVFHLLHGVYLVFDLVVCGFLVFAGLQMMQLRQWALCLIASIVAMVPCFGCCCIGLPIGVWGLVVLMDEEVKRAFTGGSNSPSAERPA